MKSWEVHLSFDEYHRLLECCDGWLKDIVTVASWNRQAGVNLNTLADLMGHKDTRMTRRYSHITPHELRGAVSLLEESYSRDSKNLAHSTKKGVGSES